jgi:hypothetical protein
VHPARDGGCTSQALVIVGGLNWVKCEKKENLPGAQDAFASRVSPLRCRRWW